MTPPEVLAVAFTLVSVWFTVKENIWCWPVGLAGVALYAVVFYQAKLYANMGLQVVFAALSVYGWYHWLHGGRARGAAPVKHVDPLEATALGLLGLVMSVLLGFAFARWTDASAPYLDSSLASFSIVAQWLMSRKLLESWIVWVAVDVVYVGLFFSQKLYPTMGLYALFLGLATRGYMEWKRSASAAAAA